MKQFKYRNKWTVCLSQHNHQSMAEANHCNSLLAQKLSKKIYDYRTQVPFNLFCQEITVAKHIVDFVLYLQDGSLIVHDVKGMETPDWKLKVKMFKACYPRIPYYKVQNGKITLV